MFSFDSTDFQKYLSLIRHIYENKYSNFVQAFKGVMPSPMVTRRTWQSLRATNDGQGPVSSSPLALPTPSPQISQASPLLPNRPLSTFPDQRQSSKTQMESMAAPPPLPLKSNKSQLNDAVAIGMCLSALGKCIWLKIYIAYITAWYYVF